MKAIIFSFIISFQISYTTPWDGDFGTLRKVEIYDGYTMFGTHSIKLTDDGLICRKLFKRPCGYAIVTKLIPIKKIDYKKLSNLQSFISDNSDFSKIDSVLLLPGHKYTAIGGVYKTIVIRSENYKTQKVIKDYQSKNPKVDSLTYLMNELIPLRLRKRFSIQ